MKLTPVPGAEISGYRTTVTFTLKGEAGREFIKLMEQHSLKKGELALQMVYHALDRTEDLRDFYRRLAILAE